MDGRTTPGLVARAILAVAAISNGVIGLWATFSPRGFYDDFPGFGQVWVAVDGPFNEHLVRDVGAWSLGLTVLLVAAAWSLERMLVLVAGLALVVQNGPHAQYHVWSANPFDTTGEKVQSLSGIVLLAVLGAVVAALAWRAPGRASAPTSATTS